MLISNAYAAETATGPFGGGDILFFVAMAAVFYFFILRPQSKRAKELKAMVEALQRGDEVVTAGGEVGRINKIYDQYVGVELAENIEVTVQKSAIQAVLPKGTIKSIK